MTTELNAETRQVLASLRDELGADHLGVDALRSDFPTDDEDTRTLRAVRAMLSAFEPQQLAMQGSDPIEVELCLERLFQLGVLVRGVDDGKH